MPAECKESIQKIISSHQKANNESLLKDELKKIVFTDDSTSNIQYDELISTSDFAKLKEIRKKHPSEDCVSIIESHLFLQVDSLNKKLIKARTCEDWKNVFKYTELILIIQNHTKTFFNSEFTSISIYDQNGNLNFKYIKDHFDRISKTISQGMQNIKAIFGSIEKTKTYFNKIKKDFEILNLFVEFEKKLIMNNLLIVDISQDSFENKHKLLTEQFKSSIESCRKNFENEINKDALCAKEIKSFIEYIEVLSECNFIFIENISHDHSRLQESIWKKINQVSNEIKSILDKLSDVGRERRYQSYFNEIFENLSLKFNWINEIEGVVKTDKNSKNDIHKINNDIKKSLEETMNLFYIVLEVKIGGILDSYDDNQHQGYDIYVEQHSNEFCNSYFAIVAFKSKMKTIFMQIFQNKQNAEKTVLDKIYDKIGSLKETINSDCNKFKILSDPTINSFNKIELLQNKYLKDSDNQLPSIKMESDKNRSIIDQKTTIHSNALITNFNNLNKLTNGTIKPEKFEELVNQVLAELNDDGKINYQTVEIENNKKQLEAILDSIGKSFKNIKFLSCMFLMFKKEIDTELDKILNNFIQNNGGFEVIGKLAIQLKSKANPLGL